MGGESGETRRTRLTNRTNKQIADDTNATNLQIANQNLEFQQEQAAYEKQLQQEIFQREDTAIQRQVADSRAAGVSPLANLSGASTGGATVAMTTPQNGFQKQGWTAQSGTSEALEKLQLVSGILGSVQQAASTIDSLANSQLQRSFDKQTFNDRADILKWQAANQYGQAYDYAAKRGYNEAFGYSDSMSDSERFFRYLLGLGIGHDKMSRTGSFDFDGRSIDFKYPAAVRHEDLDKFARKYFGVGVDEFMSSFGKGLSSGFSSISKATENVGEVLESVTDVGDTLVKSALEPNKAVEKGKNKLERDAEKAGQTVDEYTKSKSAEWRKKHPILNKIFGGHL